MWRLLSDQQQISVFAAIAESDGLHTTEHFKDIPSQRSALYTVHVILNGYMERPNKEPH